MLAGASAGTAIAGLILGALAMWILKRLRFNRVSLDGLSFSPEQKYDTAAHLSINEGSHFAEASIGGRLNRIPEALA